MRIPPSLTKRLLVLLVSSLWLFVAGCSFTPRQGDYTGSQRTTSAEGQEITLFAMGLLDTGYRFGGKNPEAGLDCSGMVSYVFEQAVGKRVRGSAADIAKQGKAIEKEDLRPGDLVFFNTLNAPFSHVGLYIGEDRFIHAPSSNGRVRIDLLSAKYYAQRFEAARAYF